MTTIVAARFETETEAERALERLKRAGFRDEGLANFYVTPPGQHGTFPLGGDAAHDRATRRSGRGAVLGAIAGALLLGFLAFMVLSAFAGDAPVGRYVGTLVAAGIGAYVGSLIGAMSRVRRPDPRRATVDEPVSRKAGPLVAARIDRPEQLATARDAFVELDAFEVEQADGTLRDGNWVDFDPRLPPHVIAATPRSAATNTIARRHGRPAG